MKLLRRVIRQTLNPNSEDISSQDDDAVSLSTITEVKNQMNIGTESTLPPLDLGVKHVLPPTVVEIEAPTSSAVKDTVLVKNTSSNTDAVVPARIKPLTPISNITGIYSDYNDGP